MVTKITLSVLLLGSPLCTYAQSLQWSISGEHGYTDFSDAQKGDRLDFHRLQGSATWGAWENVSLQTTVSVENGFNQRYPGDMLQQQQTDIVLEQALVAWRYRENHSVKLGRFYVPIGTSNGNESSLDRYGAELSPVERNIIPTHWVETGISFSGRIFEGFDYDVAMHSALRMQDGGLVRDGRQADSYSVSKAHAFTIRFQYKAIEQLLLATSIHFEVDTTGWDGWGNNSAILIQTHADYRFERWQLKGFFAYWDIDGIRFETSGREKQNGWYLEAGYRYSRSIGYFARINQWDNEQDNQIDTRITQWDAGINWWLNEQVTVKADISTLSGAEDSNRISIGASWKW